MSTPTPRTDEKHALALFSVAQGVEVRQEDLDGREHLVVPMVALIEGAYQCANCATANFYPASEFGKNAGAWNGRPVTIGHPQREGSFVSAGSPDVWQTERIGTTFAARMDGDKLRVEAWIDPEAVERAGDEAAAVLAAIEAGDQVEVSTAAWIDEMPRVGVHKDRKYHGVQVNFQPDHVAILKLGDVGACSWEDGCGIRVNVSRGTCCESCALGEPCEQPTVGQTARSRESALQIAVEETYADGFAMVVDHDDEWVYFVADGAKGLRRRGYSEDGDGNCTLADGEDERVRPRTEFVVVNQEDGDMADPKTPAEDAPEQKPSAEPEVQVQQAPEKPKLSAHDQRMAELEAKVEHLTEKLVAAQRKPQTEDEALALMPEGIRALMRDALKQNERRKLELVDTISEAPGCMYERAELEGMSLDGLQKLVSLAVRSDYGVTPKVRSEFTGGDDDYVAAPAMQFGKPAS